MFLSWLSDFKSEGKLDYFSNDAQAIFKELKEKITFEDFPTQFKKSKNCLTQAPNT